MSRGADGLARSIQDRLLRHARQLGVDPNLLLVRFAIERFLYRLSRSPHADRFVLKGALLLVAWLGEMTRPTRDADLLGHGDLSEQSLREIFRAVCDVAVEPDGMTYLASSVRTMPIRPEDPYGGRPVTVRSRLGNARLRVQVDVAAGDVVTPAPQPLVYPSLLDLPPPALRAVPPETAIAEKLHAMVVLGARNSRTRDFFDVDLLARHLEFEGHRLASAVRATFERRDTPLPDGPPLALTREFGQMEEKPRQWQAFLTRSALTGADGFEVVVGRLRGFLLPVLEWAACEQGLPPGIWPPGGPWTGSRGGKGRGS